MKKIVLVLIIILFSVSISFATLIETSSSFDPPKGNCKKGETWRCVQGSCFTTLLYCPPVYEDGNRITTESCNKTTCTWDCECVEKKKNIIENKNDEPLTWPVDPAILYQITTY